MSLPLLTDQTFKALKSRGITESTCRHYNYTIAKDGHQVLQVANYYDDDGNIIFQKTRDKDKNFIVRGSRAYRFYGQHLFPHGGKKLVITEGEIDCLTVSQIQDNKYPVVSIPFGATSAHRTFKDNYDWLMTFEEVIVMFDMDKAGKEAVEKVGGILPPNKLKIASLPLKDPNECLKQDRVEDIIKAIWNAKDYRPDGIFNAKDLKEQFFSQDEKQVSYPYFGYTPLLNKMTHGIRKGEMTLLTAGTGIGKSTLARELAYYLKTTHRQKVGLVMLEENPKKTLRDLLSIHLATPLHLKQNDKELMEELKTTYFDELFGDGNFIVYDHFGSIDSGNLLDKIRYLITCENCDFVVFDHISIAVSGLAENNDERKTIDRLMTNLRSLVEETGAGLILVSHLRKTENSGIPFEQGGKITLDDLRGSGSLKQLPDTIIALERNQQAEEEQDRNCLKIRVLKNRFTGTTGLADTIRFNKEHHVLEAVDVLAVETEKGEETSCQF